MRRIASMLVLMASIFSANAADYEEGKHYKKITPLPVESPEVREFFSFYCKHCFNFEHMIKSIKADLPEGVPLVKNHVDFLPGASQKMQRMMTRAMITAQLLNMEDKQVASMFNYIHEHNAVPTSERDMRNVFVLNGADGKEFDRLMASDEVHEKATKMQSYQNMLASANELRVVPSVVVNGKYMIDTHDLDPENFIEDYNKLVKYLLTLD
ncbi:thiol:disulfide interchange protein DsbA/DsbL [Thalassotalea sp. 1_MG-2023]|uniref:thiol:disulfide interchange protein DsbA/DsbL n=1 Tax=Thalassotalea sp. 1_MG-2023 TaxID=3062680 RepID=UPI0026E2BF00|nr:thiol:disulfide interchange protein DsbA/DsbL [Thalassotalea sp. 1_MG-2023]MDO6425454.1 thiol:disulfide interchange protein DsbA/DsbL [Thalassotalea sp. 1_MG-2023]